MISMLPCDAIIAATLHAYPSRYYQPGEWLMFYQWIFERFQQWNPKQNPGCEMLNLTSGINNRSLNELETDPGQSAMLALANLFCQVGRMNPADHFLRFLDIRSWRDLNKHIQIPGWRPKHFPNATWFSHFGRWFKKPGPNKCHPEARWHDRAALHLQNNGLWRMRFFLDYYRDGGSSWSVDVQQNRREHLDAFAKRVDVKIEEIFETTTITPHDRECHERDWNRTFTALENLFAQAHRAPPFKWEYSKELVKLADELRGVDGPVLLAGRITLTPRRCAVLRRWLKQGDPTRKAVTA